MSSMPRSIGNEFDAWARDGYVAQGGFYGRETIPLMSGLWDDNGTLKDWAIAASGTVGFNYASDGTTTTGIPCLKWDPASDNTDRWVRNWDIPDDYRRGAGRTGENPSIIMRIRVRKVCTTTSVSDNTTLAMNLDAAYHCPTLDYRSGAESDGDALITAVTGLVFKDIALNAVVPAEAVATLPAALRWMECDIGSGFTAAQLAAIKPGGTMGLKLYPSAAPGTNLSVEVWSMEMVYTRNLMPANKRNKALGARHN